MLAIDILRNYFQKDLVVLRGDFWGVWVSKRRPDALLPKSMPYQGRLSVVRDSEHSMATP